MGPMAFKLVKVIGIYRLIYKANMIEEVAVKVNEFMHFVRMDLICRKAVIYTCIDRILL